MGILREGVGLSPGMSLGHGATPLCTSTSTSDVFMIEDRDQKRTANVDAGLERTTQKLFDKSSGSRNLLVPVSRLGLLHRI